MRVIKRRTLRSAKTPGPSEDRNAHARIASFAVAILCCLLILSALPRHVAGLLTGADAEGRMAPEGKARGEASSATIAAKLFFYFPHGVLPRVEA